MNRLKLANANHNIQLILALVLILAGFSMITAGLDCWPRAVFGLVSNLAGFIVFADLIVKKRRGQGHVSKRFHDELTNRFYREWKQGSDKCPICGKIGVPIECPVNLGVECPECGPVFFDLFKQGFYEQDTVKEASRLKKEGRHERKT